MTQINFMTENATLPEFNREVAKGWIVQVAERLGKKVGTLTYVF